jgi:FKBP-type peptidyl-prolyl cis-trans isomerase
VFELTPRELEIVEAGMADKIIGHRERVPLASWGPKVNALAKARGRTRAADEGARGRTYREQAARHAGARTLPSGVIVETQVPGTGVSPGSSDDRVKVRYQARLVDGTVFDSSGEHGPDATFLLSGVIKCWTEAVGQMKVGEKALLVCPPETAYGENGQPPNVPGNATLIFEVELVDVTPP